MSEETISVDCTANQMATIARAAKACKTTPEEFALWAAVNRAETVIYELSLKEAS